MEVYGASNLKKGNGKEKMGKGKKEGKDKEKKKG